MCNNDSIKFTTKNLLFQKFPFPASFIASIFFHKHSKLSRQLFYKLYFTCKLFYSKLKVIPVLGLNFEDNSKVCILFDDNSKFRVPEDEIPKLDFKFFVYYQIADVKREPNISESMKQLVFPKIFRCEIICLGILHCKLTLKEFKMLTTKVEHLSISEISVENEKGFFEPIEHLLSYAPGCDSLGFSPCHESIQYAYTNKTAEKLVSLEFTKKMHAFLMLEVPQTFNADAFALFIKKNANHGSSFGIKFHESVGSVFKTAFENRVMASLSSCISEFGNFKLRIM